MAAARRRKPPIRDAIEHAAKGLDKTAELEVKYINSFKGMVFVFSVYLVVIYFWGDILSCGF